MEGTLASLSANPQNRSNRVDVPADPMENRSEELMEVRGAIEKELGKAWRVARDGLFGDADALCALENVARSFIDRKREMIVRV